MAPARSPTPGFLVWRLSMKWRAAVDRAVTHLGITHAQYSLLASLYSIELSGHSPSQRELADQTGLDAIYVSKLARALERARLITRADDPADTRVVRLGLTDEGRTTIRQAIEVVHDLLEEVTAPLGGLRGTRTRSFMDDIQLLLAAPDPDPTNRPPTRRTT